VRHPRHHPKVSLSTYFLTLSLSLPSAEPTTTILGTPEMYIDTGSTVNLTCIVQGLNEPPASIQWTHNGYVSIRIISTALRRSLMRFNSADENLLHPHFCLFPAHFLLITSHPSCLTFAHSKEINYDSPRGGVSVITEKSDITTSYLLIQRAKPADSGKYTCR
jgi:neurotrimin